MKNFISSNRFFKSLVLLMGLLFFIESCIKDDFDFKKMKKDQSWNPNIAVPLVYSSFGIKDILANANKNGNLTINTDNTITLMYGSSLFSVTAEDALKLPNQTTSQSFNLSGAEATAIDAVTVGQTYVLPTSTQTVAFASGNTNNKIDSVVFKGGTIDMTMANTMPHSISLNIKIPSAKKNGVVFNQVVPMPANSTSISQIVDLTGYTIGMTDGGSNNFNIEYTVTITKSSNTTSAGQGVTFTGVFKTLKFSKLFGLIDLSALSPNSDTTTIDLFENAKGLPRVTFADPTIKFTVNNSFGIPLNVDINYFVGKNQYAGTSSSTPAQLGFPSPLTIASPTMSEIGQNKTTVIALENKSAADFINLQPNQIRYKFDTKTNAVNNANFVLDTSKLKFDFDVKLPMYGTAQDLMFQDTLDFDMEQVDIEGIESLLIRTYFLNSFPIEARLQMYFTDDTYLTLNGEYVSLFPAEQEMIKSGAIDGSGRVVAAEEKTTDLFFSGEKLAKLKGAKHITFLAKLGTTNNGNTNVRFYNDNVISAKVGMQTKLKVNSKTINKKR